MMSKSGPGTMPTGFPLARTKMNSRGSARRTTKNIMRKLYLYGYGTCNFYRDAVKLATSAKSKGLIELECKRFIDSASYFEWLSKNKGVMFDDAKSRTEVESHETSPIIWTESEAEGKRLVGGCVELHTYMKETYDHGSGNCTTSRGLAGLKWQTLGMKDKARLIISLVLFLLFVFAAMAMVLFSTSIEKSYRWFLFVPLQVSLIVGGQVLTL
eukprot:g10817.t1